MQSRQTDRLTCRQTSRSAGRKQAKRQTDMQGDRHADMQTNKRTFNPNSANLPWLAILQLSIYNPDRIRISRVATAVVFEICGV